MHKSIFQELKMILKYPDKVKNDIKIHPDSTISNNTIIGKGTNINGPAFIACRSNAPCFIGKYCAIGHNLRVRTSNHNTNYISLINKFQKRHNLCIIDSNIKGAVFIGNNVWIGDNVIILSGVRIGDGTVIGAGSVVTKDIPPYSIAVGNPAKVIKKRFDDQIVEQLLKLHWWDWSKEKVQRNKWFFETDFSKEKNTDILKRIID